MINWDNKRVYLLVPSTLLNANRLALNLIDQGWVADINGRVLLKFEREDIPQRIIDNPPTGVVVGNHRQVINALENGTLSRDNISITAQQLRDRGVSPQELLDKMRNRRKILEERQEAKQRGFDG